MLKELFLCFSLVSSLSLAATPCKIIDPRVGTSDPKKTPRDVAASLSEVADSLSKVCEECFVFGVLPRGDDSLQTLCKEVNSKLNEMESESTWSFVGISRVLYNLKHMADDQIHLKPTAFGKIDSLLLKRVSFSACFSICINAFEKILSLAGTQYQALG